VHVLGDVRDVLGGVLRDVEAIATSPAVMRELLGDLREAERRLGYKLRYEVVKHGSLDGRFTGAQAVAVQQQVLHAIDYVQDRIRGRTSDQAAVAIQGGLQRTITTMEGLERRFTGVVTPLRLREAHEFSRSKAQARGMWARDFPTSVDRYGAKMLSEFEEVIRGGLIAGSSMDDIIGALTGRGGPKGLVSLAAKVTPAGVLRVREADIPEGLFVRNKYWAERLVRTELLKAYNGARQAGLESSATDHPGLKRKILAILDKRTAPDSLAVHGQIRGIKEPFVDGAGRSYLYPPARPNDRETVIPWKDEWEDSSENLSEWEKVCIGEGDAETEAKLEKAMRAIAAGKPTPTTKAPRVPKPPKPPSERPKVKTWAERTEENLRGRLAYDRYTGATFDGAKVGFVAGPTTIDGNDWRPKYIRRSAVPMELGVFATHDEARDALMAHWNTRMSRAAQSIERWKYTDYTAAVDAGDRTKMRRLVRGLLWENKVLPRDAFLSEVADVLDVASVSSMPDAIGLHHWDGRITIRQDAFDKAKLHNGSRPGMESHLSTMIHEELHGSTHYQVASFYAGYGAAVEEVTVEMAARKITSKALKVQMPYYSGAYQTNIEEVVTIVQEEVERVLGHHRGTKDRDAVADAGIAMRGKQGSRGAENAGELLDQFVDKLKVPAKAKRFIRGRIHASIRAPR
jgi:hypothetical protein